jgi:hypothetical protein
MSGDERTYGSTAGASDNYGVGFAGTTSSFDAPHFYRLCDNITSNVFAITKHGVTLEKTLKTIGSANDSKTVRESVHILQITANQTIAETAADLKQLNASLQRVPPTGGKEERMRANRLTSDFQKAVERYTDLQKQIVAKMKTTMLPSPMSRSASLTETEDQDESLVAAENQRQAQLQLQEQLEFEQGMLIEREERIRQIESDILDVNSIMRELGTMVHEQGEAIETIEDNIGVAHTQVDVGRQELEKAAAYQRTYRKRLFCLLGTGAVVLIVVVIVLITQLKN